MLCSGTGRHYRDYARNNEIAGNVFFVSNLAVRVLDDGNHVHDNSVYVTRAKTKPTCQVGHTLDPILARSVKNAELRRNWIEIQDQASRPSSIRADVVTFPGQARDGTTYARNVMESAFALGPVRGEWWQTRIHPDCVHPECRCDLGALVRTDAAGPAHTVERGNDP